MKEAKRTGDVFKGYPLLDFFDPQRISLDHILRSTSLRVELERYIKGFALDESEIGMGGSARSPASLRTSAANPYKGGPATDGRTTHSFKDRLEKFLDGLYLGCFQSSVVQPDARRPPGRYIYDVGFNTDKLTGFIVAKPFDTLVTFGPRGRHAGYGAFDPAVVGLPRSPNIKVAQVVPAQKGPGKKGAVIRPDFVTTFATAVASGPDVPKASIICDLNMRIVMAPNQQIQELTFYGDTLKVHLSKGLVQPVERSPANEWVRTGKRLALDMGNRMIMLRRNRLPTWGGPVDLGGTIATVTSSNVVGRLHRVDIGGTVEKPLFVFDGMEILT